MTVGLVIAFMPVYEENNVENKQTKYVGNREILNINGKLTWGKKHAHFICSQTCSSAAPKRILQNSNNVTEMKRLEL